MIVDIGGKYNTFKYLAYNRKPPQYAKIIVRFSDEPRDI